jgi:hypothetical protein
LYFGDVRVFRWEEAICGSYGCGGTGWWKDCYEGGLDQDLANVLTNLDVDIPEANVPEPSEADAGEDD